MLFLPELRRGPPPEELLQERWKWLTLMSLFTLVILLQIVTMEFVPLAFSGLLLLFGWRMLRDNMQEMPSYALVYSMLCGLNCCFTLLPLVADFANGRQVAHTEREPTVRVNGTRFDAWTTYTEITPFFDLARGLQFNAESLAKLLTPVSMAAGCYLAASAHVYADQALHRFDMEYEEDDISGYGSDSDVSFSRHAASLPAAQRTLQHPRTFSGKAYKVDN
mmetsp:Transcript_46428/g.86787  ORF Transcript_46428/g.86787 Transcript_46428/m.86787 type:complete len:221 (+) Transcript_46428:42-704(+)